MNAVPLDHQDLFLEQVSLQRFRGVKWAVIGCDRPLLSLYQAHMADEAWRTATIFGLPEKLYVLSGIEMLQPAEVVRCSQVSLNRYAEDGTVLWVADDGEHQDRFSAVVTCLGKRPRSALLSPYVQLDSHGYPADTGPLLFGDGTGLFWVGDVAHMAFQRVSIAIGEGAEAALRWFYAEQELYGFKGGESHRGRLGD